MTSALSPLQTASLRPRSTALALARPEGLAAPDSPQDADGASAKAEAMASPKAQASHHAHRAHAGGGGGGGARHIVDQRVTENETMRITVISYSDGSVDRLSAVKNGGGSAAAPVEPRGADGWGDRGMMVDRVG